MFRSQKIKLQVIFSACMVVVSSLAIAQVQLPQRGCGTKAPSAEWDAWFNQKVAEYKELKAVQKMPQITITIPVIVHVLHSGVSVGTYPNITTAQIKSQIKILNDDFAGNGFNSSALAATGFSAVGAADTKINFCLAQYDPNGAPLAEPGIDRINYGTAGWQNPNSFASPSSFQNYMDGTVKPATIWDPLYFLNIWVSDVHPNAFLLGYATFPAGAGLSGIPGNFGSLQSDGIWIWARAFGNQGFLDPTYNKGRTAVHEAGHWLGLRHIGGDAQAAAGDCNATDYCADTPPQKGGFATGTNGQNYGSPTYPIHVNTCGSPYGDMFMNFMDYCDDAVLYMFTPDQNDRMQTALLNGVYRNMLGASSMTQCSGLPVIEFAELQTGCVGDGQSLEFSTMALPNSSYTWSAEPSAGVVFSPSANSASPTISYPAAGNYTITVVANNTIGISSSSIEVAADICAGISKSASLGELNVWPNPANNTLFVDMDSNFLGGKATFSVFDVVGQEVVFLKVENVSGKRTAVDISTLHDGIYFIMVDTGTQRGLQRFAVRH